jgi:intracellular sulfur oxidation DsrE/DsrF family protein
MKQPGLQLERRSFFGRLRAASLGVIGLGGSAMAQVKQSTKWEPTHHAKDDWFDELPGQHRLVFDTTSAHALEEALLFAGNFVNVNRTDYGLESKDLAIVVVLRHQSTAFGYNDAMWAKYGTPLAARSGYEDPKTKTAPTANNHGTRLKSAANQGVQMAVCSIATRFMAGLIARTVDGNAEAINAELIANLVPNARMVPAGIVAVNRAQERGYSLVTT